MNGVDEALALAERIGRLCEQMLGGLVSVIVHGSLVLDDYVPGSSDIDLLAVTDRAPSDRTVGQLIRAAAAAASESPAAVDLRVMTRAAAAAPEPEPSIDLYARFDRRRRFVIESRRARDRDLAIELSLCRRHGQAIHGGQPHTTIGEVADELVPNAADAQLAEWQRLTDDGEHAELMVLTACRAWRFSVDSSHCSKAAAGRWALQRDRSLVAIHDALRRRGGEAVVIEAKEVGRVLHTARASIAAVSQSPLRGPNYELAATTT